MSDYNGWTNYSTWNVKLWIDSDEYTSRYWDSMAQEVWDNCAANDGYKGQTREDSFVYQLSKQLKAEHEENMPATSGTYADLLQAALDSVNWYEIAEHYLDSVEKEEEVSEDDNE